MEVANISEIRKLLKKRLIEVNELQEIIESLLTEQRLGYVIKAIISMIMEYITLLEMLQEEDSRVIFQNDEDIKNAICDIVDVVNKLMEWLDSGEKQKHKIVEQMQILRSVIEKRVKVLTAYEDTLEIYRFLLDKMERKSIVNEIEAVDIDTNNFTMEVYRFIFSQKENFIITEKLRSVLRYLPLRITKQKYYDYITKSMGRYYGMYSIDLDAFIQMGKDMFYPQSIEDYDRLYPHIAKPLKTLEALDYACVKEEDIYKAMHWADELTEKIDYALGLSSYAASIINKIIAIMTCSDACTENLFHRELSLQAVNEILKITGDNTEAFILSDAIVAQLEQLEGKQEQWQQHIRVYTDLLGDLRQEYSDVITELGFEESFTIMKKLELWNSDNLFVEPEQYINDRFENDRVDRSILNKKAREFIEFIDQHAAQMSREVMRARMSQLLAFVPPAFEKPDEVYDFILNSMELCRDKSERLAVAGIMCEMMKMYNY